MDGKQLEEYTQNIMDRNKGLFEKIKEINKDLMENTDIQNMGRYYRHQDILTGIYGTINVVYKQLRAFKENAEAEQYNKLKLTADYNNEKFISAVADREASAYVAPLRMARDIFEGYVETIIRSIDTCRSHIWEYKKEQKYDTGQ